jgi:hypothetical protein
MIRFVAALFGLLFATAASAQNVTVIGPVTPGDLASFNSTTVIKDSGVAGTFFSSAPANTVVCNPTNSTATLQNCTGVAVSQTGDGSIFTYNPFPGFGGTFLTSNYFASNFTGTHGSDARSTFTINRTTNGSGTNGPALADYGAWIGASKNSYLSSIVDGEVDGVYVNTFQGKNGDTGAFVGSANKVRGGTGGALGAEVAGIWTDTSGNALMNIHANLAFAEGAGGQSGNTGYGIYSENQGPSMAGAANIVQPFAAYYGGAFDGNGTCPTHCPIFTNLLVGAGSRSPSHIFFTVAQGINESGDITIGSAAATGLDGSTPTQSGGTRWTIKNITGNWELFNNSGSPIVTFNQSGGLYLNATSAISGVPALSTQMHFATNENLVFYTGAGTNFIQSLNDAGSAFVPMQFDSALLISGDQGIQIGSPTGGSKGAGTINVASGFFVNGNPTGGGSVTSTICGGVTINTTGTCPPAYGFTNCAITASVASNNLTVTLTDNAGATPSATSPCNIYYRNSTLGTGSWTQVTTTAATTFTANSGSTFGSTNTAATCTAAASCPFKLWVVAINSGAGTVLGVVDLTNASGVDPLNEGVLLSTTACNACNTATVQATVYSTAAQATKPFVILGYLEWGSGLATAGTWASAPTAIQTIGPGIRRPGEIVQGPLVAVSTGTASSTNTTKVQANPSVVITPTMTSNLIRIHAAGNLATSGPSISCMAEISRSTTFTAAGTASISTTQSGVGGFSGAPATLDALDTPGTTSATTYVPFLWSGTAVTCNWNATNTSATPQSYISVEEIMG